MESLAMVNFLALARLAWFRGRHKINRHHIHAPHSIRWRVAKLIRWPFDLLATSFGVGLGIAAQPTLLHLLPKLVQNLFDSVITSGGLTAIILCLLLPESKTEAAEAHAPLNKIEQA